MLVDYTQQIRFINGDSYREQQFIGASPFLLKEPTSFAILIQMGTAVAWNKIYTPPVPLFPEALLERKDVTQSRGEFPEWVTRWRYVMAVEVAYDPDYNALQAWPASPSFVDPPL